MTDDYQDNNQNNTEDLEIKEEKDSFTEKSTTFFERFESCVDWNLISIFSIWIFLTFTFFCIFVKY